MNNVNFSRDFIELACDKGVLRFGEFVTKAGRLSPYFFNAGLFNDGASFGRLCDFYARTLLAADLPCDMLFGPAYKGIALAVAAAASAWYRHGKDLRFFYDRKEAKAHGEGGRFIGHLPEPGEAVVMVDDVLSDGGTKVDAVAAIQAAFQTRPVGIVVAVDRRRRATPLPAGLPPVEAALDLSDLCEYLAETGDDVHHQALRRFYEGEGK